MRKALSFSLSVLMILTAFFCLPANAFASVEGEVGEVINPAYEGEEIEYSARKLKSLSWMDVEAKGFSDALVTRTEGYNFSFPSAKALSREEIKDIVEQFFYYATDDSLSVSSVDGDYIKWQVSGYRFFYSYSEGYYSVEMSLNYYDNAQQNRDTDEAIKNYLSTLDMSSYSDYELLKEFHDHILDICDYNSDMNPDYNYSCYGVFIEGKAVCQGYALAFYRLCKEAGFDVRIVTSDPNEGCHAWNLVRLGNEYYYVDTTWDDDYSNQYEFFLVDYDTLQSMDDTHEHLLYDELFDNDYFNNNYNQYVSDDCWDSTSKDISNCKITIDYSNPYNVSVYDGARLLSNGTDYTVSEDSDCYVRINGAGDYSGTYSVRKNTINYKSASMENKNIEFSYTLSNPNVSISNLTLNTDYVLSYQQASEIGSYTALAQGIGKYTGTQFVDYSIVKGDINNFDIQLSFTEADYNAVRQVPNVSVSGLTKNKDYTVQAVNSVYPGVYTINIDGKGNFTGTAVRTYEIKKLSVSEQYIDILNEYFVYDGNEKNAVVFVKGLAEEIDYTVSYSNNILPGTASVTIKGIGVYDGCVTLNYTIHPQADVTAQNVPAQSQISTTVNSQSLNVHSKSKKSTSASSPNKSTVRKPKKASISKLKISKKAIVVYWKKVSCSGYQIQYSVSSKFKKAKTVTVKGSKKTSKKISKLKKGKKYYVRVRAYKTVGSKKIYGSWSNKKSITVK